MAMGTGKSGPPIKSKPVPIGKIKRKPHAASGHPTNAMGGRGGPRKGPKSPPIQGGGRPIHPPMKPPTKGGPTPPKPASPAHGRSPDLPGKSMALGPKGTGVTKGTKFSPAKTPPRITLPPRY